MQRKARNPVLLLKQKSPKNQQNNANFDFSHFRNLFLSIDDESIVKSWRHGYHNIPEISFRFEPSKYIVAIKNVIK